jgi:MarR family transcriptional regulator, lower aerobic nicotinate degradation pathway regulator
MATKTANRAAPSTAAQSANKSAHKSAGKPVAGSDPGVGLADAVDLHELPGHHIRRLQQIAVSIFLQEAEGLGVTPIQFAALQAVANHAASGPAIDQRRLAAAIGLDTSTVGGVIDRLEARGLLARQLSADDRRVRLLAITGDGAQVLAAVQPAMQRAQDRILAPLPRAERREFMRMLRLLVDGNNDASRAPSDLS